MATFQITSRRAQGAAPPKKRPVWFDTRWATAIRIFTSLNIAALSFVVVLLLLHNNFVFILLPTFLSMLTVGSKRYSLAIILASNPLYTLLSFCLSLGYYSFITVFVLLTHFAADTAHIILVAAALAWTVILDPVRVYLQSLIEQRFNARNRETLRALEAFTATLREEIHLDQVRERFLSVIQQTMRPYSLALWVRAASSAFQETTESEAFAVAEDDPFVLHALAHPGALEITRLRLASPLLEYLRAGSVEVALPLASQGELIGLLVLGPRAVNASSTRVRRAFFAAFFLLSIFHLIFLLILGLRLDDEIYTRQELATLSALAPQVAPALRVAQMVQEQEQQVRERERIEQELRTAHAIQIAFLPKETPALSGWQLMPYYQPAREVGGDFYDFIALEDGRLGLVIGDVTGKGVPAALVMATVLTMLRSAVRNTDSPSQVLAQVNELLVTEIPPGMFVTCFYALLNPADGRICYANAGHEAPYRLQGNTASELWATGMPLGMLPGSCYDEFEGTLAPGESLLLYSDGLIEAHNPAGEMFGFPRLQTLLSNQAAEAALVDFVLAQLHSFTGEKWEQEDDVTLLALQRAL